MPPPSRLGVHMLPGTNALDVADRVRAKMKELSKRFPEGVDYDIAYDITPYIRESVAELHYYRDTIMRPPAETASPPSPPSADAPASD